jgi:catechol 2,3-dioxygenase
MSICRSGASTSRKTFIIECSAWTKTVWNYPGALFLAAGGYHHHLGTNTWSSGPAPSPNQAQLLEWQLVVPSLEDVAARNAACSPLAARQIETHTA